MKNRKVPMSLTLEAKIEKVAEAKKITFAEAFIFLLRGVVSPTKTAKYAC